jgi:hypothetical protein
MIPLSSYDGERARYQADSATILISWIRSMA